MHPPLTFVLRDKAMFKNITVGASYVTDEEVQDFIRSRGRVPWWAGAKHAVETDEGIIIPFQLPTRTGGPLLYTKQGATRACNNLVSWYQMNVSSEVLRSRALLFTVPQQNPSGPPHPLASIRQDQITWTQ